MAEECLNLSPLLKEIVAECCLAVGVGDYNSCRIICYSFGPPHGFRSSGSESGRVSRGGLLSDTGVPVGFLLHLPTHGVDRGRPSSATKQLPDRD